MAEGTATVSRATQVHWHHPEWVAVAVAGAGWLALAFSATTHPSLVVGGWEHHGVVSALTHAVVMAEAMMALLVVDGVRRIAVHSFWDRRYRAAAAYLAGYLATWALLGWALMLVSGWAIARLGWIPCLVAGWSLAVAVSTTQGHRRRLRRCQASRPLALRGRRADVDCVREGVAMAGRCFAVTWALMLAVTVQHGLVVMAAATVLMVRERRLVLSGDRLTAATFALGVAATGLSVAAALAST